MGLLSPGDEAIIPAPYWVSYPDMVRLAGAEPVIVESGIDADFKITPEQLAAALPTALACSYSTAPAIPRAPATQPQSCRPWARPVRSPGYRYCR